MRCPNNLICTELPLVYKGVSPHYMSNNLRLPLMEGHDDTIRTDSNATAVIVDIASSSNLSKSLGSNGSNGNGNGSAGSSGNKGPSPLKVSATDMNDDDLPDLIDDAHFSTATKTSAPTITKPTKTSTTVPHRPVLPTTISYGYIDSGVSNAKNSTYANTSHSNNNHNHNNHNHSTSSTSSSTSSTTGATKVENASSVGTRLSRTESYSVPMPDGSVKMEHKIGGGFRASSSVTSRTLSCHGLGQRDKEGTLLPAPS
jgi:hypothetical protein